jgi:uncharacterized membrane protein YhaH (DUF805 family)
VRSGLQNYVNFSGRARRSEYWWFALFYAIVLVVAMVLDGILGTYPLLYAVAALGLFLPILGLGVRRLQDTNRPGVWILIGLIPVAGTIILIIFLVAEGTPGDNRYGPAPQAQPAYGS